MSRPLPSESCPLAHGSRPTLRPAPARLFPARTLAARIAVCYALLGALWIFYSGWLLYYLVHDPALNALLENVKGWFYVAVTAALLWLVLNRYFREIRRSAEKIQESEERLRLISDNLPNGYVYRYTRDADGEARFDYLSAGVERIHGVAAEDALEDANLLLAQCEPDQLALREAAELESARNLTEFNEELHIRRADGRMRTISLRAQPRRTEYGKTQWDGFVVDTTDSKQAEKALADSERQYRELVQNASNAIIRWKCDGTITFVNEWAQQFFGYTADEMIGKPISILVPASESKGRGLIGLISGIVKYPERYGNSVNENVCRDGRRVWMSWTNKPLLDNSGQVEEFLCIGSDITARMRAEAARRESENRFRELFEHTGSGVAVYKAQDNGEDFVLVDINLAGEQTSNVRRSEVIAYFGCGHFVISADRGRVFRVGAASCFG